MPESAKPLTFLIFSGPTREYIDPVRFISNESSGKTGFELAKNALGKKHKVIFISGPVNLPLPKKAENIDVISAEDMFKSVKKNLPRADIVIGAAAVSDFRPVSYSRHKIKKQNGRLIISLKQNPDIIAYCGKNKKKGVVAGFALETKDLIKNAKRKMQEKNLDLIIANGPEALGSDKNSVKIIFADNKTKEIKNAGKNIIAGKIIDETIRIFQNSQTGKKVS